MEEKKRKKPTCMKQSTGTSLAASGLAFFGPRDEEQMETELHGRGKLVGEMKTDERDVQGAGVTGSRTTDAGLHTLALTNSQHSRIKEDGAEL